jgi:hypothetical protein
MLSAEYGEELLHPQSPPRRTSASMQTPGQRRSGRHCAVVLFLTVAMIPQSIRADDVPRLDNNACQCAFPLDETVALDALAEECEGGALPLVRLFRVDCDPCRLIAYY